jgi:hypothetical protein
VKLPDSPENAPSGKVPRSALIMMILIVTGMLAIATYSNVQNWRRDKIEKVIVTPIAIPTPSP